MTEHSSFSSNNSSISRGKSVRILLVEDNAGDLRLTQEAFKDGKLCNNLMAVKDGVEAMSYLRREGRYSDAVRPDIILLDLNLPKKSGQEVLEEIKTDKELERIPVIILTTSKSEEDIRAMYDLHADAYINKPVDIDHFIKVVKCIEAFWIEIVALPGSET
ncbi:MAG: response regulator [Candidatus Scalindua sp.]|nr:response regulator [Candidatus Scalindua sp.]MBT6225531.1 response regulator [Candidatus Scalindua sp.]MBT6565218.1 response regulator [Candidatus Scalindua sp.]MBT7210310.1 response regulator [Candidatus Scalindua sp.]MBT7591533.1 response regulator [Candidatus Scalindua sp.]